MDSTESVECDDRKRDAHMRSSGMILSFFLITPFMMPWIVLGSDTDAWLQTGIMWVLLRDDKPKSAASTGSMPVSSKKLSMACKSKRKTLARSSFKQVHSLMGPAN